MPYAHKHARSHLCLNARPQDVLGQEMLVGAVKADFTFKVKSDKAKVLFLSQRFYDQFFTRFDETSEVKKVHMEVDADRNQAAAVVTHIMKEKFPHSQEHANIPICVWALHTKQNENTHYAAGVPLDLENKKVSIVLEFVVSTQEMNPA